MDSTELIEADRPAKRELYSGFGNGLSYGFEFVAIVGILYLIGHWIAGTPGGVLGIVIGWIGATAHLFVKFRDSEPIVRPRAARPDGTVR